MLKLFSENKNKIIKTTRKDIAVSDCNFIGKTGLSGRNNFGEKILSKASPVISVTGWNRISLYYFLAYISQFSHPGVINNIVNIINKNYILSYNNRFLREFNSQNNRINSYVSVFPGNLPDYQKHNLKSFTNYSSKRISINHFKNEPEFHKGLNAFSSTKTSYFDLENSNTNTDSNTRNFKYPITEGINVWKYVTDVFGNYDNISEETKSNSVKYEKKSFTGKNVLSNFLYRYFQQLNLAKDTIPELIIGYNSVIKEIEKNLRFIAHINHQNDFNIYQNLRQQSSLIDLFSNKQDYSINTGKVYKDVTGKIFSPENKITGNLSLIKRFFGLNYKNNSIFNYDATPDQENIHPGMLNENNSLSNLKEIIIGFNLGKKINQKYRMYNSYEDNFPQLRSNNWLSALIYKQADNFVKQPNTKSPVSNAGQNFYLRRFCLNNQMIDTNSIVKGWLNTFIPETADRFINNFDTTKPVSNISSHKVLKRYNLTNQKRNKNNYLLDLNQMDYNHAINNEIAYKNSYEFGEKNSIVNLGFNRGSYESDIGLTKNKANSIDRHKKIIYQNLYTLNKFSYGTHFTENKDTGSTAKDIGYNFHSAINLLSDSKAGAYKTTGLYNKFSKLYLNKFSDDRNGFYKTGSGNEKPLIHIAKIFFRMFSFKALFSGLKKQFLSLNELGSTQNEKKVSGVLFNKEINLNAVSNKEEKEYSYLSSWYEVAYKDYLSNQSFTALKEAETTKRKQSLGLNFNFLPAQAKSFQNLSAKKYFSGINVITGNRNAFFVLKSVTNSNDYLTNNRLKQNFKSNSAGIRAFNSIHPEQKNGYIKPVSGLSSIFDTFFKIIKLSSWNEIYKENPFTESYVVLNEHKISKINKPASHNIKFLQVWKNLRQNLSETKNVNKINGIIGNQNTVYKPNIITKPNVYLKNSISNPILQQENISTDLKQSFTAYWKWFNASNARHNSEPELNSITKVNDSSRIVAKGFNKYINLSSWNEVNKEYPFKKSLAAFDEIETERKKPTILNAYFLHLWKRLIQNPSVKKCLYKTNGIRRNGNDFFELKSITNPNVFLKYRFFNPIENQENKATGLIHNFKANRSWINPSDSRNKPEPEFNSITQVNDIISTGTKGFNKYINVSKYEIKKDYPNTESAFSLDEIKISKRNKPVGFNANFMRVWKRLNVNPSVKKYYYGITGKQNHFFKRPFFANPNVYLKSRSTNTNIQRNNNTFDLEQIDRIANKNSGSSTNILGKDGTIKCNLTLVNYVDLSKSRNGETAEFKPNSLQVRNKTLPSPQERKYYINAYPVNVNRSLFYKLKEITIVKDSYKNLSGNKDEQKNLKPTYLIPIGKAGNINENKRYLLNNHINPYLLETKKNPVEYLAHNTKLFKSLESNINNLGYTNSFIPTLGQRRKYGRTGNNSDSNSFTGLSSDIIHVLENNRILIKPINAGNKSLSMVSSDDKNSVFYKKNFEEIQTDEKSQRNIFHQLKKELTVVKPSFSHMKSVKLTQKNEQTKPGEGSMINGVNLVFAELNAKNSEREKVKVKNNEKSFTNTTVRKEFVGNAHSFGESKSTKSVNETINKIQEAHFNQDKNKTIIDSLSNDEINKLVDRFYDKLERKIINEKRRFGL